MRSFGYKYLRPMGDVRQFETPTDANKHVHLIQRTGFYRTLHSSCYHKYVLLLSQYHLAYHDISLYTKPGDWRMAAVLPLPQDLAITLGGVLLSIFGSRIRNWQWQKTVAVTIMVIFGSLLALAHQIIWA
jgi:hypothetical protein